MRAGRALPLIVAAFALRAPAFAGTAGSGFTGPAFRAANLEANNLSVSGLASGKFQFYDASAGIPRDGWLHERVRGMGSHCSQTDPAEVLVFLEDRDDNFLSHLDDRLSGGPANDISDGGPGNDAGPGADTINRGSRATPASVTPSITRPTRLRSL